ncbi:MAG: sugar phosphate isomerase/epimerase [Armatimonadetes bacterium]|nr:sugar phosphate isomerase/epimerase [Armatimonadota bacterium]
MKFSAVTMAVGHSLSLEKALATIKRIGFDGVLFIPRFGPGKGETVRPDGTCPTLYPDVLRSDPEHVLKAMDNAGLKMDALYHPLSLDVESDEGVDRSIAGLKETAEYALALGCKCLSHAMPRAPRTRMPTEEKAPQIRRFARLMNTVAEAYAGSGLRLAYDIHAPCWVNGLDDCRLLLDSMPCENACLLLNVGQLATAEAYGWLLVEEYPNRIPIVGWKDHSLAKDRPRESWSIELGTGHTPLALYVQRLKRNPADRVHLVNCENVPDEERVGVLTRSLKHLNTLWEEVE